ncbi:MAG: 3-hydroxyacyl-ACP dehydratase FabZ [Alphaproteobacteria bacterium]|nr:3-hydroxyacyl-ACP dehydratase FabZ [Alphaproteobacteria bacterium]NCP62368.1 3-hydroxyacyl-ACP dehydratase FabZ [Alphaproteobacteria bacterium]NCQ66800.1 3-hydroxyacyl-ACP dehydratase FabZ [Alphaproteobacteria bacterium]NCT07368.1 3-hydroxyacyl-ACP dehydratase FabZ [Alphaproteobacteria bacterium]
MSQNTLTVTEIMELIPHRYPMLLVDRIQDIVAGESCTGFKNVTFNEPFFQGHFPREPIMPGVLIVEAMAQTAGALVIHTTDLGGANSSVYFMNIEEAKFRRPVVPGDVLEMKVEKSQSRGSVWKFSGKAYVNGKVHAEAKFTAMIVKKD